MKRILIIGATGSLGQHVIEALKNIAETELTLFSRSVERLPRKLTAGCKVIQGDVMDFTALEKAVQGKDIVYINLAGNLEAMTRNIVKAMQETGVSRVIAISSIGIYDTPMKAVLKPYRALADVIETSGLNYTILRPDWFTDGNEIDYAITYKGEPEKGQAISRKSIAAFIASIVQDPSKWANENLGISKGVQ